MMNDMGKILQKQREFFQTGKTRELSFRLKQLKILRQAVLAYEGEIIEALEKDLQKSPFEGYATEVGIILDELRYFIKNLPTWVKPKRVKTPIYHFLSSSKIYYEPYGVSLIISPWNYPFQLSIAPLIGSIGAGNCSLVKPSPESTQTSLVLQKMIGDFFADEYVAVVLGGKEVNTALLAEKFDYIFFTGSVFVGKVVMAAASKHLTPVTLELGGKSPCIVDREANLELAAKRIAWGKFLNAGQTCVAPDYLLVSPEIKDQLLSLLQRFIKDFYGDQPLNNNEYPRIINEKHFQRLRKLLEKGKIICGGEHHLPTLKIAPTIIDQITWDDPVMQEEIFGPILPVLEYDNLAEVIQRVNSRPKPLALYLFSTSRQNQQKILENISFGGGCINDTIIHLATPYLPFGGVGDSGLGGYHGQASFQTFSHQKSLLKKSNLFDLDLRYPPYKGKLKLLKKIMK